MRLAVAWALLSGAGGVPPDGEVTRYVRVSPSGKAAEAAFTVRRGESGWAIESVTTRGRTTLTVTSRYDAADRLLEASAVLVAGEDRKAARVSVAEGRATVAREGLEPQAFDAPAGLIVTSAPDWTDTFLLSRRYDRGKGGRQEFQGLWIHPQQPAQRPTFSAERTGGATVEHAGKRLELDRLAIRLRGGSAYVGWSDAEGRLLKLVSLPYKEGTADLVLEGFEESTAALRPE